MDFGNQTQPIQRNVMNTVYYYVNRVSLEIRDSVHRNATSPKIPVTKSAAARWTRHRSAVRTVKKQINNGRGRGKTQESEERNKRNEGKRGEMEMRNALRRCPVRSVCTVRLVSGGRSFSCRQRAISRLGVGCRRKQAIDGAIGMRSIKGGGGGGETGPVRRAGLGWTEYVTGEEGLGSDDFFVLYGQPGNFSCDSLCSECTSQCESAETRLRVQIIKMHESCSGRT
ncbi:hypothetical protein J6590_015989 [Homalodisca vitripennis]|nr:hypothetical protein J6590_015989 [Homalodisca vitripennis]